MVKHTNAVPWTRLTIPWGRVFKGLNSLIIDIGLKMYIFISKVIKYKIKNEKILNEVLYRFY